MNKRVSRDLCLQQHPACLEGTKSFAIHTSYRQACWRNDIVLRSSVVNSNAIILYTRVMSLGQLSQ